MKNIYLIIGSESHTPRGKAVLIKEKAKGNRSLMSMIVQRRAFVLQTHHCESVSLGLKPNLFGIYGNKVSCSVSLSFFFCLPTQQRGGAWYYAYFGYSKVCFKSNFPSLFTFSTQKHPHRSVLVQYLC